MLASSGGPDSRDMHQGNVDKDRGDLDTAIHVWNLSDGTHIQAFGNFVGTATGISFNYEGRILARGDDDGNVSLWDVLSGKEMASVRLDSDVYGVAFDRVRHELLRVSSAKGVTLFAAGRKLVRDNFVETKHGWATNFAVDGDGRIMISGGKDGLIRVWEARHRRLLRTLEGHTDVVTCLDFMSDAMVFASKSRERDSSVRLWNTETGLLRDSIRAEW